MLVEDVEANADLAKIRLEQQSHSVTVAWNGREAVEAFIPGRFDVIIMDIQMPQMDGLEATRRIRALEADSGGHVPIIAMTAAVMREEMEKYLEMGMDAVVAKPINFDKLFKTIEDVVPEDAGKAASEMNDKKWKVLVADDEPKNLWLLGQILKDHYQMSFATDGLKALDAVQKTKPDIILLSIIMPLMDGYEICRRLKGNPETANIPIIFLSALTEEEEKRKGMDLGAVDFITKPFDTSEIQTKVKEHLLTFIEGK